MVTVDMQAARLGEVLTKWATPPTEAVDQLPKPTSKDNKKGRCNECGGWHGLPAVHLDYVGHAWVTRALIEADPLWSWEPMALSDAGEPLVVNAGGHLRMWIRLTVHGKSLPAVGTCPASKPEPEKELVGDALRNGAMRFGIALSLWAKDEWSDLRHQGPAPPSDEVAQAGGNELPDAPEFDVDGPGADGPSDVPTPPDDQDLRGEVEALRREMTAGQKSMVRAWMAANDVRALGHATVDELAALWVECQRVLAEGDAA